MRLVGLLGWAITLAASLVFLWLGVFHVLVPNQGESALCVGVDRGWFLTGVLANLAAAGIALGALRARWWSLGIALPGLSSVVAYLLFPCSFVLPLLLPASALIAIASAVVVIVGAVRRSP